jgi:hypothetical protein
MVEVADRAGVPGCAALLRMLRSLDVLGVLALPADELLCLLRDLQEHAIALGTTLVEIQRQTAGVI